MADIETINSIYFFTIIENTTLGDTRTIVANFPESISEGVQIADRNTQQTNYLDSIVENIRILDNECVFGWFAINDDQAPQWGTKTIVINEIADFGGFTFGGIPFAGNMYTTEQSSYPVGYTPTTAWNTVNTTDNASWIVIDNRQKC